MPTVIPCEMIRAIRMKNTMGERAVIENATSGGLAGYGGLDSTFLKSIRSHMKSFTCTRSSGKPIGKAAVGRKSTPGGWVQLSGSRIWKICCLEFLLVDLESNEEGEPVIIPE